MYLEAVTVCVNYDDFLEQTLPFNRGRFDNMVVVTTADDKKTQKICYDHHVEFVITNRLFEDGASFNKGKAINDGINALSKKDWIVHLDADMAVPPNLRAYLVNDMTLDPECIYGAPRHMCTTLKEWNRYRNDHTIGSSWPYQGKVINIGVGYFQLWNSRATTLFNQDTWYPEQYNHAGRSDRMFWRKWAAENRRRLDVDLIHLGSDDDIRDLGVNWRGRVTPRFDH